MRTSIFCHEQAPSPLTTDVHRNTCGRCGGDRRKPTTLAAMDDLANERALMAEENEDANDQARGLPGWD